jgi:hypothetical protein
MIIISWNRGVECRMYMCCSRGAGTAGSLTTAELLANASQQLVVSAPAETVSFHLNPTEPHNYQVCTLS